MRPKSRVNELYGECISIYPSHHRLQLCCITAVISAPTDVHVHRMSLTTVEVTWNPPAFHGVAGYRIEYSAVTDHDELQRPRFLDTGPFSVAQVGRSQHCLQLVCVSYDAADDQQLIGITGTDTITIRYTIMHSTDSQRLTTF